MAFNQLKALINKTPEGPLKEELKKVFRLSEQAVSGTEQTISTFLVKTETVVSGGVPSDWGTTEELLSRLEGVAWDLGITTVHITEKILNWFLNQGPITEPATPSRLTRTTSETSKQSVIQICQKAHCYTRYELNDAIMRTIFLLKAGKMKDKNSALILVPLACPNTNSAMCALTLQRKTGVLIVSATEFSEASRVEKGAGFLVNNDYFPE